MAKAGIHVVVAAGNEDMDACKTSPAREATGVTVGATDIEDRRLWLMKGAGRGTHAGAHTPWVGCWQRGARGGCGAEGCSPPLTPPCLPGCPGRQGLQLWQLLGPVCPRHRHPQRRRKLRQRAAVSQGRAAGGAARYAARRLGRPASLMLLRGQRSSSSCTPAAPHPQAAHRHVAGGAICGGGDGAGAGD